MTTETIRFHVDVFRRHGYELRTKFSTAPENLARSRRAMNAYRRHLEEMDRHLQALAEYPELVQCLMEEKVVLDQRRMNPTVKDAANARWVALRTRIRQLLRQLAPDE